MSVLDRRSLDSETKHALVADSHRRYLLGALAEMRTATVAECVHTITLRDRNRTLADEDARDRLRLSLVHNHLPRLADHDVVEYDAERGQVTVGDSFDELAPIATRVRPNGRLEASDD